MSDTPDLIAKIQGAAGSLANVDASQVRRSAKYADRRLRTLEQAAWRGRKRSARLHAYIYLLSYDAKKASLVPAPCWSYAVALRARRTF